MIPALATFAAIGSAMMGGLLFAFSNFVMKALAQQPPEAGIRTMQAINITIINPLFFVVFAGTALASMILLVAGAQRVGAPGSAALMVASGFYLLGTVGITLGFNVPLNNVLATQTPAAVEAGQYWAAYVSQWLRWNHGRTLASIAATGCFILALRQISKGA